MALLLPLGLPAPAWAENTSALLIKDINAGPASSSPDGLTNVNGTLFFAAADGIHGTELWKNASGSGTTLIKDINPGTAASNPTNLTNVNGMLFFTAAGGSINAVGLWKSDGTEAGTTLVKSNTDDYSVLYNHQFLPSGLTNVNGTLFFSADDGINGSELWKSDGTTLGTTLVKDIAPGGSSSGPKGLTNVNGTLFFSASDIGLYNGSIDYELWKSDGTEAGTTMVKDINSVPRSVSSSSSNPFRLTNVNGTLFFSANDGVHGDELWKSDGTTVGTVMVRDINTQPNWGSDPNFLTNVNGLLVFTANDGSDGTELWKSDGTILGTTLVKDIYPGLGPGEPKWLTRVGASVLFSASNDTNGRELWRSDGTGAGTTLVKDINPGSAYSYPNQMTNSGGTTFLVADDGIHGSALWKSDGTGPGTTMVADINPFSNTSPNEDPQAMPSYLTDIGGTLFFSADDGVNGRELWKAGVFAFHTLTVTKGGGGSGTVTSSPAGIDCGVDCSEAYEEGSQVTLTPAAASGSSFAGWGGGCAGTAGCTVTMDQARSVSATFVLNTEVSGPTTVSVGDLSLAEGSSGTTAATFTLSRSGTTSGSSTVRYKTGGGTATVGVDYTAVALTAVSFAPGETTKTVTVEVAGDTLPEAAETFTLVLSAPTGTGIADSSGTATIVNDDGAAYLAVGSVTVTEGNDGTAPVTFTISRSGNTNGSSTVSYQTATGTAGVDDFTAVGLTPVSFAPGETAKTVTVEVKGDTVDESNETFTLGLSAPVGATIADSAGTATIVDNEGTVTPGPATFLAVANLSVAEGAPATFSVTRTGNTTVGSSVKYKTGGGTATAGTDYTAITTLATLSFAAGETTKTVTVDTTGDTLPEADETFNLSLSTATGAVIADASGTATILNDDGAAYLAVTNTSVTETNSGTATAIFRVSRSGNTTGQSKVKVYTGGGTATAGTDYTAVGLTDVTFAAGETTKIVTVDITGDTTIEANETFYLILSTPSGATISDAAGTATILNDD